MLNKSKIMYYNDDIGWRFEERLESDSEKFVFDGHI